jgi:threonylcarbamoyladenosine tRNA methylthiotransferase MtaB
MRRALASADSNAADGSNVFLLNACTVTQLADRKARQLARRIRRTHPDALIVVIGCLADAVERGWGRFDEADLLAGNCWKHRVTDVVAAAIAGKRGLLPRIGLTPLDLESTDGPANRVRALLKVQDGCSRHCAYCRPTHVRGPTRSKSLANAVAEAASLVHAGYPEIVLTGINLAEYAPQDGSLADLIAEILHLPELVRLRIASINLTGVDDAFLDACASDHRVCRHLHVPLQSGDDRILDRMGRGYSTCEYRSMIERVRNRLPNATFGTDLIVGFPGEDDVAFAATCDAVQEIGFANLHVFRFSPRPGTAAADLDGRVPENIKRQRAESLNARWRETLRRVLDTRVGSTQDVLVERRANGRWSGYTSDYLYVSFTSNVGIGIGAEVPVRITDATDGRLEGGTDDRANTS